MDEVYDLVHEHPNADLYGFWDPFGLLAHVDEMLKPKFVWRKKVRGITP